MNSELGELLFGAASALSTVMTPAEPPPPPPPVVVETTAHVNDESLEVTVDVVDGETVFDLDNDSNETIWEDEPGWDCRTMGNRRCGTFGPNGEDWWYEYDELGETIVDEGPVFVPGPPPVPADEIAEQLPGVIVVDLTEVENRLVMTCLNEHGHEVDLDAIAFTAGHWQSCYPIGGSKVEGFGL